MCLTRYSDINWILNTAWGLYESGRLLRGKRRLPCARLYFQTKTRLLCAVTTQFSRSSAPVGGGGVRTGATVDQWAEMPSFISNGYEMVRFYLRPTLHRQLLLLPTASRSRCNHGACRPDIFRDVEMPANWRSCVRATSYGSLAHSPVNHRHRPTWSGRCFVPRTVAFQSVSLLRLATVQRR